MPIIMMIAKNWKVVSLLFGLTAILIAFVIVRDHYIDRGYRKALLECNAEKVETINENITIKRKQDKIVPFSGKREFIDGLRDGSAL